MRQLTNECFEALSPILKQCSSRSIFISENGEFRALSNSGTMVFEGVIDQTFPESAYYDCHLVNKHGEACDKGETSRYLKKSAQGSDVTISKLIKKFEENSDGLTYFLLRHDLCRFMENRKMGIDNMSINICRGDEGLHFSINLDDTSRYSNCQDEILIHDFDGDECRLRFLYSSGLLNEIKRVKNEEFWVTVFHSGILLLESTVRDFTVLRAIDVT